MKASVFRRWPVTAPYRGEQTTRLTGGHDFILLRLARKIKKTEEQIKKETKWICVDLDREEARIYKKMVKENTDFGGRRNEL